MDDSSRLPTERLPNTAARFETAAHDDRQCTSRDVQATDCVVLTRVLDPDEMVFYKVVGNEEGLAAYNQKSLDFLEAKAFNSSHVVRSDWTAMYTQLLKSHAMGTVPYRWETRQNAHGEAEHYDEAHLVEVRLLQALEVVVCKGCIFFDGQVSGTTKAAIVKSRLGLEAKESLMQALGHQGKALLVQETEGEWELVISHEHLASLSCKDKRIACFYRHRSLPTTVAWCAEDGIRRPYASDDDCVAILGESIVPAWLLE
eukprot:TRINITY_DN62999_c0_g1_i1.p1 TRINITY_DN62999_c0_g1~~TRINITY_DN62999_c0_g1_i1.p1  ORF type:complete len:258 (-),score=35.34 TRINITY_DN62999_c0_g1_i1:15-788(-)